MAAVSWLSMVIVFVDAIHLTAWSAACTFLKQHCGHCDLGMCQCGRQSAMRLVFRAVFVTVFHIFAIA